MNIKNLFKSEQQIVAEIHNEFDTAQDRLLEEAKAILSKLDADEFAKLSDKANRLSALGFTNSEPVTKTKNNPIVKTKEQAELIAYYKQTYPFQKFLTETELERICKKYNLIFAPVSAYKKDVPEKNLQEIEKCSQIKGSDVANNVIYCEWDWDNSFINSGGGDNWASRLSEWRNVLPKRINKHFFNQSAVTDHLNKTYNTGIKYICGKINNITEDKQGLFIAAPQSHFDLKDLKKTGVFGFAKFTIVEPKDPIVFRYCRGGIQVLSKWGLEASDELLLNEINN